jgi:dephospho-CoA kinase
MIGQISSFPNGNGGRTAVQIVGLTGLPGSGKGTFIEFLTELLRQHNAVLKYYSLSDELRAEVRRRRGTLERPILRETANMLRASYGNGILADMVIRRITAESEPNSQQSVLVVDAIRTVAEVEALRGTFGDKFVLVALEAPESFLIDRVARRARYDEAKAVILEPEAARKMIRGEAGEGEEPHGHDISACIRLADQRIMNAGSLEALKELVRHFTEDTLFGKRMEDVQNAPQSQDPPPGVEDYFRRSQSERIGYLEDHLREDDNLVATFWRHALARETTPLARWYLIKGIGLARDKSAVPLLLEVFRNPNHEFRETSLHGIAAWTLGRLRDVAVPWLLSTLVETHSDQLKLCIADALGETRSSRAIPALRTLFNEGTREIKLWAALSLAKIGVPAQDIVCTMYEKSGSSQDKMILIDAIAKLDGSDSSAFLGKILKEGSDEERQFVLSRFGKGLGE